MDSAELSNFAKMRFNQSLAKKNLDAKIESILTLTYGGGLFNIDYSLISFVNAMHQNNQTEMILRDSFKNPVKIDNVKDFLDQLIERYQEAYKMQFDDFLNSIIKKTKPNVSFEDGKKALIIANSATESVKYNKFIKIKN